MENTSCQQSLQLLTKIKEFEEIYGGPFEIVYKDVLDGTIHWDAVPSVGDYTEWEILLEDFQKIKTKLNEELFQEYFQKKLHEELKGIKKSALFLRRTARNISSRIHF